MRIGVYDPYLDDLGGGEKYMMTLASCLAKSHSVVVFWDDKTDIDNFVKRFDVSLDNVAIEKNIFSKKISAWERLMITKQFDVLIVLSDGSIPLTFSKKLFLHVQQPLAFTKQAKIKTKLKLAKVTKIFYNSEFTRTLNSQNFPGVKTAVIYPPVRLVSNKAKKENIILHVGRYRIITGEKGDYKKQGFMVDTFKNMVDQGLKDWKLVIAAAVKEEDKASFAKLQRLAKDYPITFMINKTSEDLGELYSKAKIYWHASGFGEDLRANPALAEHFGISTVEAMSAGAVPVVINAGGQKEIIEEGKTGFLWDTPEELIEKTNHIMKEQTLWNTVSKQAKMRATDFSIEKFSRSVNEIITQ